MGRGPGGLLVLALCLALSACSQRQGDTGGPRFVELAAATGLETELLEFVASHPLPAGFEAASPAGHPGGTAAATLALSWGAAGPRAGKTATGKGKALASPALARRWLAAAVDLADPRWNVSEAEALALGLEDLDNIELPRRALPVDGRFPGEAGWPFVEELRLELRVAARRDLAPLSAWLGAAFMDAAEGPRGGATALPAGAPAAAGAAGAASSLAAPGAPTTAGTPAAAGISDRTEKPASGLTRPFILGAVGDIVAGPEEAGLLLGGETGRDALFGGLVREMRRADCLIGNLESPVAAGGTPNPRKRYRFLMPPGSVGALRDSGFDILGFANNHVLDFGEEALLSSLDEAKAAGLPLVGAGRNSAEALAAAESSGGLSVIGFAAYPDERWGFTTAEGAAGPAKAGVNADEAATREAIRSASARGRFVVVFAHGGNEYRFEPAKEVRARYRSFIEAGASCVIASHPHVLQGAEAWKGGLIAYSLGNYLFTGGDEPAMAQESAMLFVIASAGKVRGLGLVPVFAGFTRSDLSHDPSATLAAFSARSKAIAGLEESAARP